MTGNEIIQAIDEIKQTEKKLKESKDQLKKAINNIGANIVDILKESDYTTVKEIFDTIKYYFDNKSLLKDIESVIETKKIEKYPELLKPTYYPEINTLNISDSEKLRLDKYARMNLGKYMSGNENPSYTYPLSVNDLELLNTIDIVEKFYTFKCNNCGRSHTWTSEKDINKYKRDWELAELELTGCNLTQELIEELNILDSEGYDMIYAFCPHCDDDEIEIDDLDKFEAYMDSGRVQIMYKVIKKPNLKYESL